MFVDWSARNRRHRQQPTAHAVWTGQCVPALQHQVETYHRTRHAALAHIRAFALQQVGDGRRLLLGFDFPYGYPKGFAQTLGLGNGPTAWSLVWAVLAERIQDTPTNNSNRFAVASELNALVAAASPGPFWGCPPASTTAHLRTTSPGFPFYGNTGTALSRLRVPESRLPGTQESWKLYGNGSVGSQALVGIPYVHQLRHHAQLRHCSKVWPFETQFTNVPSPATGPFILHAEIWPSVVRTQTQALLTTNHHLIPDQAQVRAMCNWASGLDQQGNLGQYFAPTQGLTPADIQICTEQEGWVLGAI